MFGLKELDLGPIANVWYRGDSVIEKVQFREVSLLRGESGIERLI